MSWSLLAIDGSSKWFAVGLEAWVGSHNEIQDRTLHGGKVYLLLQVIIYDQIQDCLVWPVGVLLSFDAQCGPVNVRSVEVTAYD